jgi:hypothetical protein
VNKTIDFKLILMGLVIIILNSNQSLYGQSMPNSVMSAGGENVITSSNKIQFSIGETVTFESTKTTLGFHSIFSKSLAVENLRLVVEFFRIQLKIF